MWFITDEWDPNELCITFGEKAGEFRLDVPILLTAQLTVDPARFSTSDFCINSPLILHSFNFKCYFFFLLCNSLILYNRVEWFLFFLEFKKSSPLGICWFQFYDQNRKSVFCTVGLTCPSLALYSICRYSSCGRGSFRGIFSDNRRGHCCKIEIFSSFVLIKIRKISGDFRVILFYSKMNF